MARTAGTTVVLDLLDRRRAEFDRLYFKQKLALRAVAKAMKVSVQTLIDYTDTRNIKRRGKLEAQRNRSRRIGKHEQVIRLRLIDHLTLEQIAERLNYASKGTVHAILARYRLDGPVDALPSYEQFQRDRNNGRRSPETPAAIRDGDPSEPAEAAQVPVGQGTS